MSLSRFSCALRHQWRLLDATNTAGALGRHAGRRHATSLPQIPGVILTNDEIPSDHLVSQVRSWARSSERLSAGTFDMLQLAEPTDNRLTARAICGLLRTELQLAHGEEPVRALVVLFYRARDFLNREFWEDQVRRLTDVVAGEYLGGGSSRGVQLTVHQNAPAWALGLELGDHRLLAEFGALHVIGAPRQQPADSTSKREAHRCEFGSSADTRPSGLHELCSPADETRLAGSLRCGEYVLRDEGGTALCGLDVLGALPLRLVCGSAWAQEGREAELGELVATLRSRSRRPACSLLADVRDSNFQQLCKLETAPMLGRWCVQRRVPVAVTGVPANLKPEEQAALAQLPLRLPWEFLPFHAGRIMWL